MDGKSKLIGEPARIIPKLDQHQDNRHDTQQPFPSREPVRRLALEVKPLGKLLYKNEVIIRQMCDCIAASRMHDGLSSSQVSPFKYIVEHFISTPSSVRWSQLLRPDLPGQTNEFEIEWSRGRDINLDHLVLVLSSVVPVKKNVKELIDRINEQCDDDLVYPGMPIRVHGTMLSKNDMSHKKICLHGEGKCMVQVTFGKSHDLDWSDSLLQGRSVFVLGIIRSIGKNAIIESGALLL